MSLTRLVTLEDVPVLVDLLRANREFFAPYEPHRDEHHFTDEGQRAVVERVLREYEQGVTHLVQRGMVDAQPGGDHLVRADGVAHQDPVFAVGVQPAKGGQVDRQSVPVEVQRVAALLRADARS